MSFNYEQFYFAVENFLLTMEKVTGPLDPRIAPAIEPVCDALRIGRISVNFFETAMHERQNKGRSTIVFDSVKGCDDKRIIIVREETGGEAIAIYNIFQQEGGEDWSGEERERISFLQKMIFAFNGRANVMELVGRLSYYDQQLGIHNLRFVLRYINQLAAKGIIGKYAAIYINLHRFFVVNQRVGRDMGTTIMRKFIDHLSMLMGNAGEIGRIGGDNFLLCFPKPMLDMILRALAETPVRYGDEADEVVKISAKAGVYRIDDRCESAAMVMDRVGIALAYARNTERQVVFFDEELLMQRNNATAIESYFPTAVDQEEYVVFLQPKVSLITMKLAGAEALCRWRHNGRLVPPGAFIPYLEQTQAICKLDFYILEHTCMAMRRWLDEGKTLVRISVNMSRKHLVEANLVEQITAIVDKYSIPHHLIEIELTETTTDVDFHDLKALAFGLHQNGFCTAIDDFGVGYSSLNLIKEAVWDVLKIDKSLMPDEKTENEADYDMLMHIISIAKSMGLECIAEGVETIEQVELLRENGCDFAQGYYFDKPMPEEEFVLRLAEDFSYSDR